MRYKYTMYVYNNWNGAFHLKEDSNNLEHFDKYKHKENYRIVIKEGRKVIYDERQVWKETAL